MGHVQSGKRQTARRAARAWRQCGWHGRGLFTTSAPPPNVDSIVTNPPFGKQGRLAEAFISHALELVPFVAMLLRVDFDSAKSRQHLFRHNPYFAGKVVLLNRVNFFDGPSSPSDNHSWFLFDRGHSGPPIIRYASNTDLQLDLPASSRWLPARGPTRSPMHSFELAGHSPASECTATRAGASLPARFDQTEQRGNTHATDQDGCGATSPRRL